MNKTFIFAKRNIKEIMREPISLVFAIGLPIILLVLFQQFNIPSAMYLLPNFAPATIVFGYGFISMFSGILISKDRTTSFLSRLYSSPMKSYNFILGYTFSLIPLCIIQSTLFYGVAILLGLEFTFNVIISILLLIPISLLFIGIGLLLGVLFNDKAVSGIGSLLVNLSTFTSGMWFPIDAAGKLIELIGKVLPFSYCINISRNGLIGNYSNMGLDYLMVFAHMTVIYIIAIMLFKKRMISDNK